MVKEHRVHGLTNAFLTTECKREVAHTARNLNAGQVLPDPAGCFDIGQAVAVVFLHPCCQCQYVWIDDDILGREADFACKQIIRALCYFRFSLKSISLSLLIKEHHHNGCPKSPDIAGLLQKSCITGFKADGIDHRFALRIL